MLFRSRAFRLSTNHLEVCKWLYGISLDKTREAKKINIHWYNDEAFRSSCRRGNLETSKWLYNLSLDKTREKRKINIHYYDENAFISSCSNGHL